MPLSLALLAGLNALVLICLYVYFKGRIDRRLEAERLLERLRSEAGRIVGEMIQDLNRITDRNITLMENKVEELQRILDTADKRILLMRSQAHREEEAERLSAKLRKTLPDERAASAREGFSESAHGFSAGGKPLVPGKELPPDRPAAPAEEQFAPPADEILDLYRRGISPELIAKRLNLQTGEVRLVISLREQKGKNRE
jgi:hypothetical protein